MSSASPEVFRKKFQTGQSLIEIIATIAIGTVLILALVALSVRATRNSDFSKSQSQASKLASEGLEVVNYLRTTNGLPNRLQYSGPAADCIGAGGAQTSWDVFFIQNIDDSGASCGTFGRRGVVHQLAPGDWRLHFSNDAYPSTFQVTQNGRTFTREVYVADSPPKSTCNSNAVDFDDIKQFTVVVSWTDTTGDHQVTTTSCIQR